MKIVCTFFSHDVAMIITGGNHKVYLGYNSDNYGFRRVGWLSHVYQAIPRYPRWDTTRGQDPRLMPGKAGGMLTEEAHDTRSRPKVAEKLKAYAMPVAN